MPGRERTASSFPSAGSTATVSPSAAISFDEAKVYEIVDVTLKFFEENAKPSERFANCLDRVGWDVFEKRVEEVL